MTDGWPDWTGATVVIAASGPSQNQEDMDYVRGKALLLVINNTWELAPWADALYACDARWWASTDKGYGQDAFKTFGGLKFIGMGTYPGCIPCGVPRVWGRMLWDWERVGHGGNSGFQAVNLATVCRAAKIVLTGFDMSMKDGIHWHGGHSIKMGNPRAEMLTKCVRFLDAEAAELKRRGVEVINASRASALTAYRRAELRSVL